MAPEIHLKQPYQGRSVDLFAAAIILFIMVAAHPPFTTAEPNDPFYRCIAASRADIFWRTHCKSKEEGDKFFSEEFKELVQAILQLDPVHRPSIPEILAHTWMQGEMPTDEEIREEFIRRDLMVKEQLQKEKEEKLAQKQQYVANRRQRATMRSANMNPTEQEEAKGDSFKNQKPLKALQPYEKLVGVNTEFFSTYNPDMIEEEIIEYMRDKLLVEPKKRSNDQYKLTFDVNFEDQTGKYNIELKIRILSVDDSTVCVEFSR